MTTKTTAASQLASADELDAARTAAWEEHQQRCESNEPYTDGVTREELAQRVGQLRRQATNEAAARQPRCGEHDAVVG